MAFAIGVIYCVYILIDTQLILGGKNKELTLDNYVMGAMILYVDIIGLFLKILQLLGEKKKKWFHIHHWIIISELYMTIFNHKFAKSEWVIVWILDV